MFERAYLDGFRSDFIKSIDYDPFHTKFEYEFPSSARNRVHTLVDPEDNCFVFSANMPINFVFKPHEAFVIEDGCLWEKFEDRGEVIVSFVIFTGLEENRVRKMADGSVIIQAFGAEAVVVGAEDSEVELQKNSSTLSGAHAFNLF